MRVFHKRRADRTYRAVVNAAKTMVRIGRQIGSLRGSHWSREKLQRKLEKAKVAYARAVRAHAATL